MHETAIIQSLLEQVGSFVPEGAVLKEVRIDVGRLEHLDETVMQATWAALTEGTELAETNLHIDRIPVRLRCRACGGEYEPQDLIGLACPACDVARPEVLAGGGVLLRSLEVDEPVQTKVNR
jgi:hydrogenase nickel incorporation protein HypA/HybF